jgi:hypothetical protein
MGIDESWEARVCMRVVSTLCPSQTRTRVAWELMRVHWVLLCDQKRQSIYPFQKGGGQSWPMDVIYYRLYYECPRSEGDVPIPGLTPFCAIKFEPVQSQW